MDINIDILLDKLKKEKHLKSVAMPVMTKDGYIGHLELSRPVQHIPTGTITDPYASHITLRWGIDDDKSNRENKRTEEEEV